MTDATATIEPTGHPSDDVRRESVLMASGGLALGLLAGLMPSPVARLFGFPAAHVTPTARMLARLYAIREAARSAHLIAEARSERGPQTLTIGANLAIDVTDAVMAATVLARREEIGRAPASIATVATCISLLWLRLFLRARAASSA